MPRNALARIHGLKQSSMGLVQLWLLLVCMPRPLPFFFFQEVCLPKNFLARYLHEFQSTFASMCNHTLKAFLLQQVAWIGHGYTNLCTFIFLKTSIHVTPHHSVRVEKLWWGFVGVFMRWHGERGGGLGAQRGLELTEPRTVAGGGRGGVELCRVMGPPLGLCRGTVRDGSCTGMSGTCVMRATCAGCATMTPRRGGRGGGRHCVCRDTCRDMGKRAVPCRAVPRGREGASRVPRNARCTLEEDLSRLQGQLKFRWYSKSTQNGARPP